MLDFDQRVDAGVAVMGGIYRRYCDDIMVVVPPEQHAEAEALVHQEIQRVRLRINDDKTDRVLFPIGRGQAVPRVPEGSRFGNFIQYLGFTYDGVRILIRPSSLSKFYSKMRDGVSLAKQTRRKYNKIEIRKGLPPSPLRKRKLYIQYSYLITRRRCAAIGKREGKGNFLIYARDAAHVLGAPEIKKQVRRHWSKLRAEIRKEEY